jgi:hypothetical protein
MVRVKVDEYGPCTLYRTMIPVEIVLTKEEGDGGK